MSASNDWAMVYMFRLVAMEICPWLRQVGLAHAITARLLVSDFQLKPSGSSPREAQQAGSTRGGIHFQTKPARTSTEAAAIWPSSMDIQNRATPKGVLGMAENVHEERLVNQSPTL